MSSFTSPLIVKIIDAKYREIYTAFHYYIGSIEKPVDVITVPAGFRTDYASVPNLPVTRYVFPRDGEYVKAAVIHDYLYYIGYRADRKLCDQIFLEAMEVLKVPYWKRITMYRAVRAGGWKGWNMHRRRIKKSSGISS